MHTMRNGMKKIVSSLIVVMLIMPGYTRAGQVGDVAAVITQIKGKLQVSKSGSTIWSYAREGDFLYEGDSLKTNAQGMAALTFVNGIEVKLNKNTVFDISVSKLSDRGKGNTVKLSAGQAWSRVLKEGTQFDVETPAATVAIRGTTCDIKVRKKRIHVFLLEGTLFIENEYGRIKLQPGTRSTVNAGSAPGDPQVIPESERETWQQTMADNAALSVRIEKPDAVIGYPVRCQVAAINTGGRVDTSAKGRIHIASSNNGVAFSKSRKGKDRAKTLDIILKKGKGEFWAFPVTDGSTVITARADGFDPGMGRLYVFQPSKKNLEIDLETPDGQRKTIKLKLRR